MKKRQGAASDLEIENVPVECVVVLVAQQAVQVAAMLHTLQEAGLGALVVQLRQPLADRMHGEAQ